ncbi:hemolysin family protein [Myxococcota bacterium]|nr:hemolysin family protein [Myxococcota bacterium]
MAAPGTRGMLSEILILVALVLVNGLFAGAEIATVTVRKTRIDELVEGGSKAARAIAELRANPERFLATVQVGITVVSAAAAAYGGDTLADRLTPLLEPVLGTRAHSVAFASVVAGISYMSLVLGELVPKSLALRAGEAYALVVARPLLGLATIARPLVWLLTKTSNAVLMLFGDKTSFTESRASAEELKVMLEEAGETGELHPRVGEIASRAMDLNELHAVDVMVPRTRIFAIAKDATLDAFRRFVTDVAHSKIPVYEGSVDQIVGFVSVRDAFTNAAAHATIAPLTRPITFVPEAMSAADVLQTLQAQGAELAIVVDEHGGTAGLLTREDLAEELFGEATRADVIAADRDLQRQADGTFIIAGHVAVRDVNRKLELELPEHDEWSTVAGMCVGLMGRIPAKGERVDVPAGPLIEILDASPRRVRSVRLVPRPVAADPS